MIKNDLIDELYRSIGGISRRETAACVDDVFAVLSEALDEDERVRITRFGVFETRHKNARMGRNPKTLEAAEISARRVVTFRASEHLLKRLNSEEADRAISSRESAIKEADYDEIDSDD